MELTKGKVVIKNFENYLYRNIHAICKHFAANPHPPNMRLLQGILPSSVPVMSNLRSPSCFVHKGGCRSSSKNYKPVALTSHMTKVFE